MAVTVDEVKAHLRIQHDEEDGFYPVPHRAGAGRGWRFLRVEFRGGRPAARAPRHTAVLSVFYYENRDVPDHQTYATMREAF